jgi:hypothetical protein
MTYRSRPAPSRIPFNPYLARERFVERMRRPHPVTVSADPLVKPVVAPANAADASERGLPANVDSDTRDQ